MKTPNETLAEIKENQEELVEKIVCYLLPHARRLYFESDAGRLPGQGWHYLIWAPSAPSEWLSGELGKVTQEFQLSVSCSEDEFNKHGNYPLTFYKVQGGRSSDELGDFENEVTSREDADYIVADADSPNDDSVYVRGISEVSPEEKELLASGGTYIKFIGYASSEDDDNICKELSDSISEVVRSKINDLLQQN